MNTYVQYEIHLTAHAHGRYMERVEQMERDELQQWCRENISNQNYRIKSKLIQIDDVWFGFRRNKRSTRLFLTTCLGRSHFDLPEAILWAERHNDRINLRKTVK